MELTLIEREYISKLIFCIYKSTHLNSLRSMKKEYLEKSFNDIIDGASEYTKYYPSKLDSSRRDIDEVISNFKLELNDSGEISNWLNQTNHPLINCSNPRTESITIAQQFHNTKNNALKSGTCKTCTKDCNSTIDQPFLEIIKSNITYVPKCSIKMSSNVEFTGFSITFERNISNDRYTIKRIRLNMNSYHIFRRLVNRFSKNSRWQKITDELFSTQDIFDYNYQSQDCKVNLNLIDSDEKSSGSLAELIKRGYYPLIKYKNTERNDNFELSPIVNCLSEMRRMVEFSCNPLYFENMFDMFTNHYPSFDFLRLSDEKYLAEISWKCLSCTANLSSLERLSNELSASNSLHFDGLLFNSVTDGNLDFLNFEFNVDTARFWMC